MVNHISRSILKALTLTQNRWSCHTSTKTNPSAHQNPTPVRIEEEQVHSRSDQTSNVVQVSNHPVSLSCDVATKPSSPLQHGNKAKGASPRTIALAKSLKNPLHCCVCNKQYKTRAGLYKHRRAEHPCTINSSAPITCNCSFKCQKLKQLRFHLQEEHNIQMEAIRMDFNDAKGIIAY